MAWSRKSRHDRGYGPEWDRTRKRILERDSRLCQPCLRQDVLQPAKEVDHVRPKAEGGTDDDNNLQAICGPCHRRKTAEESARALGHRRPRRTVGTDANGWPREG